MRFTRCLNDKVREGGRELLAEWCSKPASWLWINIQNELAADEEELLFNTLRLDAHTVAKEQRSRHPPGFAAFPEYIPVAQTPYLANRGSRVCHSTADDVRLFPAAGDWPLPAFAFYRAAK